MLHQLPQPVRISMLGEFARDALGAHATGDILAVFRRSFYIRLGPYALCLGPDGIGKGPINIITRTPSDVEWLQLGLLQQQPVRVSPIAIGVADRIRFDFAGAEVWRPPKPPQFSLAEFRTGLTSVFESAQRRSPGGLGAALTVPDLSAEWPFSPDDPLLRLAQTPIRDVAAWISRALARKSETLPPSIESLIGLGPGLTPSGDDFVGGLMVALHYLGFADIATVIAGTVLPIASRDTNTISAQLLRCAAAGQAAGALFDVLEAILTGGSLQTSLDAIDAIGHTSGWDSLAGAVLVCTALSRLEEPALTERH
ncbi:MAG: DUF2877 domain-containing protein [Hyphomicrobiales bacterium]|nr:DUF2877 domain-containing protein [Hyphomicrobiales bacterium]